MPQKCTLLRQLASDFALNQRRFRATPDKTQGRRQRLQGKNKSDTYEELEVKK
ncbi:MAG: hypothetical protein MUP16_03285 [Sedimentisphaerales bacterium]|nr:hypothetical protein [Sedimentisphaerales bacterium]